MRQLTRDPIHRLFVIGWLLLLCLWVGCGTPEDRYRTLSFFFDGVPPPGSVLDERTGEYVDPDRVFRMHKPFEDGNCEACHTTAGPFTASPVGYSEVNATVCLTCHEDQLAEFPWMHGPVVGLGCLWCHEPHEARYDHLLIASANQICAMCHDQETMLSEYPPAHSDPERNCLECHHGHGGQDQNLLRPGWDSISTSPEEGEAPLEPEGVDVDDRVDGEEADP